MAYFECISGGAGGGATITVTYDSSFYNKTITCSNGTKTYTKTTTSSGSTEFSVSDEVTWTITCNGVSVSLNVTLNYATQMKPTGSTATPVNDIQTWLKCGGIFDKSYTTINQVLADTTTLLALISDSNAVDYMVRSTTWASDVCANSTAMTDIGANDYCADTLLSDATWRTAICNSTYFESVLNVKVPTMTSATTPEGEAGCTDIYSSSYPAWHAFAGGTLISEPKNNSILWYKFTKKVAINKIVSRTYTTVSFTPNAIQLVGSDDGLTWIDIGDEYIVDKSTADKEYSVNYANTQDYLYVGIRITSNGAYSALKYLQFYGRA